MVVTSSLLVNHGKRFSGYMLFVKEYYHGVQEDNPDLSVGEIGKLLGEMRRDLSDEEKKEYS